MKYLYVLSGNDFGVHALTNAVRIPSLRFFFPAFGVFSLRQYYCYLRTIDLYIKNFILWNMAFVWRLHSPQWNNQVVGLCRAMESYPSGSWMEWIFQLGMYCIEIFLRVDGSVRKDYVILWRAKPNLPCKGAICTQERCEYEWYLSKNAAVWAAIKARRRRGCDYRLRCICLGHSVPSVNIYWQTQGYISDIGASYIIPGWIPCPACPPKYVVQARAMYMSQYLPMKCRKVVFFWWLSPQVTKIKSTLNPETPVWA